MRDFEREAGRTKSGIEGRTPCRSPSLGRVGLLIPISLVLIATVYVLPSFGAVCDWEWGGIVETQPSPCPSINVHISPTPLAVVVPTPVPVVVPTPLLVDGTLAVTPNPLPVTPNPLPATLTSDDGFWDDFRNEILLGFGLLVFIAAVSLFRGFGRRG